MDVKQEQDLIATMAQHTEKLKVCEHRISDLEVVTKRIESLTLSVEKLAVSCEAMAREQVEYRDKQNELAKRILEVEQYPNKRKANAFDKYAGQVIAILIGALVSFLLVELLGIQP